MIRFIKLQYLFVITLTLSSGLALAQERRELPKFTIFGEAENQKEEHQITQLVDDYISAWRKLDANAFISLHTHDIEWTNAFARIFQNSKTLGQFLETRLFPQFAQAFPENESLKIEPVSLRYLSDDVVIIHLYTDFPQNNNQNTEPRRTHFHLVAHQIKSTWKIAHTAIMDAR